jgi:hypothetical protein
LLDALDSYEVYTVRRYLEEKPSVKFVIFRHDVDRIPKNALRMARMEAERGVLSTYYFRVGPALDLGIVREVYRLGHEVGYHYETLSKVHGDRERAMGLFGKELQFLRSACEVKTISRHGRPLSRFDNEELWKGSSFEPYGVLGDAGLSIVGVPYYTDAGRSWDGANSIRDRSTETCGRGTARNSYDVIMMLRSRFHDCFYLNIHPERWTASRREWATRWCIDLAFNYGKKIVHPVQEVS